VSIIYALSLKLSNLACAVCLDLLLQGQATSVSTPLCLRHTFTYDQTSTLKDSILRERNRHSIPQSV